MAVLSACQKSELLPVKMHLLDHISDDIVRNGGLFLCDAGFHKHTILKHSYGKKAKRRRTEMDHLIAIAGLRVHEDVRKPQGSGRNTIK